MLIVQFGGGGPGSVEWKRSRPHDGKEAATGEKKTLRRLTEWEGRGTISGPKKQPVLSYNLPQAPKNRLKGSIWAYMLMRRRDTSPPQRRAGCWWHTCVRRCTTLCPRSLWQVENTDLLQVVHVIVERLPGGGRRRGAAWQKVQNLPPDTRSFLPELLGMVLNQRCKRRLCAVAHQHRRANMSRCGAQQNWAQRAGGINGISMENRCNHELLQPGLCGLFFFG